MKEKSASKNGPIHRSVGEGGYFTFRLLMGVLLCFAGVTIVSFALGPAAAGQPRTGSAHTTPPKDGFAAANKIAPEVLADTADGKSASVIILLADQEDVSAGYGMRDQDARGWLVYNTLSQHAARTQRGIRNFLDSGRVT